MNWDKLYLMQEELDSYIVRTHDLQNQNVFNEKVLAFLVELGELANETRCFKFWSTKPPSEREVILAEYVDGIHFLLSLGLEKGYRYQGEKSENHTLDSTEQFNIVFSAAATFKQDPTVRSYLDLFKAFITLGEVLGFEEQEIYDAYVDKNEINYERQDKGY